MLSKEKLGLPWRNVWILDLLQKEYTVPDNKINLKQKRSYIADSSEKTQRTKMESGVMKMSRI